MAGGDDGGEAGSDDGGEAGGDVVVTTSEDSKGPMSKSPRQRAWERPPWRGVA